MDLIDRSKINFYHLTGPELISAIEEAPTIDATPVVHGRWQWISSTYDIQRATTTLIIPLGITLNQN